MAVQKIDISEFLCLAAQHPVLDVRSPAEYQQAHLPGAYSLPLFTDEERKIVGTAYKLEGREQAIRIGLDFFGPKMKAMVDAAETIVRNYKNASSGNHPISTEKDRPEPGSLNGESPTPGSRLPAPGSILLYCWRGGMRSAGVAWLLDLYGFRVYTLAGGYKKFRRFVLDTFSLPFSFRILGGFTGSGKTELLNALEERGEKIIDLEKIASHKGSAFGNIGMPPQPTQEMFENLLAVELQKKSEGRYSPLAPGDHFPALPAEPIWLEDESQRIGLVNLPNELWKTMRSSPLYFLEIPFEERLRHVAEEYGGLDKQRMTDAILRIREKLGGLNAKNAIQLLEEGNTIGSFRILLKYYDKYYLKALHNREEVNSLLQRIESNTVSPENASLLYPLSSCKPEKV